MEQRQHSFNLTTTWPVDKLISIPKPRQIPNDQLSPINPTIAQIQPNRQQPHQHYRGSLHPNTCKHPRPVLWGILGPKDQRPNHAARCTETDEDGAAGCSLPLAADVVGLEGVSIDGIA